jgi:hypothetical protein
MRSAYGLAHSKPIRHGSIQSHRLLGLAMTNATADSPVPEDDDDLVIEESSHSAAPSPAPSPQPRPPAPGVGGVVPRPADVEPLPLEIEEPRSGVTLPRRAGGADVHAGRPIGVEPAETAKSHVKSLDVCPNCGANMSGAGELVCLRCGFDLKTMKKVTTRTGTVEVDDEEVADEGVAKAAISAPGKGDLWLPAGMAIVSGLLVIVSYLSGAHGLFLAHQIGENGVVKAGDRFLNLLQFVVLASMWIGCGIAALAFVAHLLGMKLGDLKLTAMRVLGIVMTMSLVRLLDFTSRPLEVLVETVGIICVFGALSLALFNVKPRDLPTLAGSALILFLLVWLGGSVVVWATTSAV